MAPPLVSTANTGQQEMAMPAYLHIFNSRMVPPLASTAKMWNSPWTTCDNEQHTYQQLAGYGFVPSKAGDKYGDTLGGCGGAVAIDRSSWKKSTNGSYTGVLWAILDRGGKTEGTLNYQNRVHKVAVTLTPRPNATLADPSETTPPIHL
ncbi:hypothetical protein IMSHALPRED_009876 [Imshaugia aleurites]|uniref:Uncharacterized protein n=1 Tax=Imshaugia aleurites TaxID=172621 RepID=A0A8H3G1G4_9LECA|nr:hypothetical protein IMSHALPRED_009876 [Imshaugia aleurites]